MARALDAGSGDAFTGRTSELREKEKDPQPDRVGFNPLLQRIPTWFAQESIERDHTHTEV